MITGLVFEIQFKVKTSFYFWLFEISGFYLNNSLKTASAILNFV